MRQVLSLKYILFIVLNFVLPTEAKKKKKQLFFLYKTDTPHTFFSSPRIYLH